MVFKLFFFSFYLKMSVPRNDTPAELQLVKQFAEENGAFRAVICDHWAQGGAGALDLADAVIAACDQETNFDFLYPLTLSIQDKIRVIATEMYGAGKIEYTDEVLEKIKLFTEKVGGFCSFKSEERGWVLFDANFFCA